MTQVVHTFDEGRAVTLHRPENKMSCAQCKTFFCSGVDQKSSRVEIHSSGVENGNELPVEVLLNQYSISGD